MVANICLLCDTHHVGPWGDGGGKGVHNSVESRVTEMSKYSFMYNVLQGYG